MALAFSLTINGIEYAPNVMNGATFKEVASSMDGAAYFNLLGSHQLEPGQSVALVKNGTSLWEGVVTNVYLYSNADGPYTAVSCAPTSANLNITHDMVVTAPTDSYVLANQIVGLANVGWGSNPTGGMLVGDLSIQNLGSALTTIAAAQGQVWRCRNGNVEFVSTTSGEPQAWTGTFATANISANNVLVMGGAAFSSRVQLAYTFPTSAKGTNTAPVDTYVATYPEVAGADILDFLGNALAAQYGTGAIASRGVDLGTDLLLRAGDMVTDAKGVTLYAQSVTYVLSNGDFDLAADFGPPALATSVPVGTQVLSSIAQLPTTTVAGDFFIRGGDVTDTALELSVDDALVSLGNVQYEFTAATFVVPSTSATTTYLLQAQITENTSGTMVPAYILTSASDKPVPGYSIAVAKISANTAIVGIQDMRVRGGVTAINLAHNTYPAPTYINLTLQGITSTPGMTSDVGATLELTNVPQDGSVTKLGFFYRTYNQSEPGDWTLDEAVTLSGLPNPPASQTLSHTYQQMQNGGTVEFGVAYLSIRGTVTSEGIVSSLTPSGYSIDPLQIGTSYLYATDWTPNGVYTADAGQTGIDAAITTNPTLGVAGQAIVIYGNIKKGDHTKNAGFRIGYPNAWWIDCHLDGSGIFYIGKVASDNTTFTAISQTSGPPVSPISDTQEHSYALVIQFQGTTVTAEAIIDNVRLYVPSVTISNLLPGQFFGQVFTGGSSGILYDFDFLGARNPYGSLPNSVQSVINPDGTVNWTGSTVKGTIPVTAGKPNPNLSQAPALATGTSVTGPWVTNGPAYINEGGGTYAAPVDFTLSVQNPDWLRGVRFYAVARTSTNGQQSYSTSTRTYLQTEGPSPTGAYNVLLGPLDSATAYDLYVTYVDAQNQECQDVQGNPLALLLGTTQSNPIIITNSQYKTMPSGTTVAVVLPGGQNALALAATSVGASTYTVQTAGQFLINVPNQASVWLDTTSTNWLVEIELVAQLYGTSNWFHVDYAYPVAPSGNANPSYSFYWGNLTCGASYNVGLRLCDAAGNKTAVLLINTTQANPIQQAAIGAGAVGLHNIDTTVFDSHTNLIFNLNSVPVSNLVAKDANGNPVTNIGTQTNTNAATNVVSTNNIQQGSVGPTQVAQNTFTTHLQNSTSGYVGYNWYWDGQGNEGTSTAPGDVAGSSTAISNGAVLEYNVGSVPDVSGQSPYVDTMTIAANATATLLFKHGAFKTGPGSLTLAFTGSQPSASQIAPQLSSPAISGSGSPSISHTTTTTSSPQAVSPGATFSNFQSTASITKTANPTTYTLTQHNAYYNNSNDSQHISGATFTGTNTVASSQVSISGSTNCPSASCTCKTIYDVHTGESNTVCTPAGSGLGTNSVNYFSVGNAPSSGQPVTGSLNFSGFTSNANVSTYVNIKVYDPNNTLMYSGTFASNATWTLPSITSGAAGTWSIAVQGETDDTSGDVATFTYGGCTVSFSGSIGGYQGSVSYSMSDDSNFHLYAQVNCVAPTSTANQLTVNINGTAYASDAHGNQAACEIVVQKADGSGTWVIDTRDPASGANFTYYSAGETCTSFYVWMRAIASVQGSGYTGTITLYPNIGIYYYWYQNDANPTTYTFGSTSGSTGSISTSGSNTTAPTTAATEITLAISSLSFSPAQSDANGTCALFAQLYDPNGNAVSGEYYYITATGNYAFYYAGAPGNTNGNGFQVLLWAVITGDNQVNADSYTITSSGSLSWYQTVTQSTTTFTNHAGTEYTYQTPASTVAPTATGTALTLTLTSVNTPEVSGSHSYLVIYLLDPSNNNLQFQYSFDNSTWYSSGSNMPTHAADVTSPYFVGTDPTSWTDTGGIAQSSSAGEFASNGLFIGAFTQNVYLRYYATGAPGGYTWSGSAYTGSGTGGSYKWVAYTMPESNDTVDTTFSCSWQGTMGYYLQGIPPGGLVGVRQGSAPDTLRLATSDGDIDLTMFSNDTCGVQVQNTSAANLSFSVAITLAGV